MKNVLFIASFIKLKLQYFLTILTLSSSFNEILFILERYFNSPLFIDFFIFSIAS